MITAFQQPTIVLSSETKVHTIQQTTYEDENASIRAIIVEVPNIGFYVQNSSRIHSFVITMKYNSLFYNEIKFLMHIDCLKLKAQFTPGLFANNLVVGDKEYEYSQLYKNNKKVKFIFIQPTLDLCPNITFKQDYILKIRGGIAYEYVLTEGGPVIKEKGISKCALCNSAIRLGSSIMQNNKFVCKECTQPELINQTVFNYEIYNFVRSFKVGEPICAYSVYYFPIIECNQDYENDRAKYVCSIAYHGKYDSSEIGESSSIIMYNFICV